MNTLPDLDTCTEDDIMELVVRASRDEHARDGLTASAPHVLAVLKLVESLDHCLSARTEELQVTRQQRDEAARDPRIDHAWDAALLENSLRDAQRELERLTEDRRQVLASLAEMTTKFEAAKRIDRESQKEIGRLRMLVEMHQRIASGALQVCADVTHRITVQDVATAVGERLATDLVAERAQHQRTQTALEMALLRLGETTGKLESVPLDVARGLSLSYALRALLEYLGITPSGTGSEDLGLLENEVKRLRHHAAFSSVRKATDLMTSVAKQARRWLDGEERSIKAAADMARAIAEAHRQLVDYPDAAPVDIPDRDVVDEFEMGRDQSTPTVEPTTMAETVRMRKPERAL